jgi:hypothetical protein
MSRIKLISFSQAAAMLQPHMKSDAAAWLSADQTGTPQLRSALVRGRRYYSASDVAAFIVRVLDPDAVIENVPRDASFAQRKRPERRKGEDRRKKKMQWPAHMERRKRADRRLNSRRGAKN